MGKGVMRPSTYIAPDMFEGGVTEWPFGDLEPQAYSLIMIDPPWRFLTRSKAGETKSPQAHYTTMTLQDIARLPVGDLAAANCLLWLWATAPGLRDHLAMLDSWGFEFASSGVWVKTTTHGKIAFGTGYVLRNAHEPFVLATRGNPEIMSKSVRSVLMAPLREHSRKPDEAYLMARQLIPYGRAADVFSRETRPTWESFGDQAGHFDEEPVTCT